MTGHAFRRTGTCISNSLEASGDNQLSQKFIPGAIAWTKIHNHSWWPAQVVDEKSIGIIPKKKLKDEILVRLYGSYEYLYMDPLRCNMEFEKILKQDNITIKDAFQKSLEEELSRSLSGISSKRKFSHFRENTTTEPPKGKMQKQEKTAKNQNQKVGSSSPGSSSQKKNEVSSEQKEKDSAIDKTASNTKTKQDEARKQRVYKKYSEEASEGKNTRQGTPENQNTTKTKRIGASRAKSISRDYLRRSPRNAGKKHEMEKDKLEHLSGKLNMMDKVKSGASNFKDTTQLGSRQLKQKDKEQGHQAKCSPPADIRARKIKVMRSLGLIAPSGSPFHRNGISAAACLKF